MFVGNKLKLRKNSRSGFTIVELIIVIVVIAILAAIIIVAYNGVRTQAIDSRIKGDLSTAASKLGTLQADDESNLYAATFSLTGIPSSTETGKTEFIYNVNVARTEYCLQGRNTGRTWFITEDNTSPQTGTCSGITGVPGNGNYDPNNMAGSQTVASAITSTNGASQIFQVTVPANMDFVHFKLTGVTETGNGANMRTKQGSAPSSGSFTCTSINNANYETCYHNTPTSGVWYIEVYYSGADTYSDVSLTAEWGYWETYSGPISVTGGQWARTYYKVTVPAGTQYLSAWTANGTKTDGGANVTLRYNSPPGTPDTAHASADCYSITSSNNENCYINNPTAGTWYVGIIGGAASSFTTSTFNNVDFQVDMGAREGTYTAPVTISSSFWTRKIYDITVPAGLDYISFSTTGGTSVNYGANLATRKTNIPGTPSNAYSSADCYSVGAGNYQNCVVYSPTAGTYYASVFPSSAADSTSTYDNVTFKIETGNWPGAYTGPVSLSGGLYYRTIYSISVPAGKTSITASTSGGTYTDRGANLAMRYNAWPGNDTNAYSSADCYSVNSNTNNESCTINNPSAGTWYVVVFSGSAVGQSSTFSNTTLTITTAP